MRRFWVSFTYDCGRQQVNKAMDGLTGRHIAAEIRNRYPDAKIEAISSIRRGISVAHR